MTLCFAMTLPATIKADTQFYNSWSERGVKYICYSKNILDWHVDYDSRKIVKKMADQTQSGILVNNEGYSWNTITNSYMQCTFKNKLLVGAELDGVTIGWDTVVRDRVSFSGSGSANWDYNI